MACACFVRLSLLPNVRGVWARSSYPYGNSNVPRIVCVASQSMLTASARAAQPCTSRVVSYRIVTCRRRRVPLFRVSGRTHSHTHTRTDGWLAGWPHNPPSATTAAAAAALHDATMPPALSPPRTWTCMQLNTAELDTTQHNATQRDAMPFCSPTQPAACAGFVWGNDGPYAGPVPSEGRGMSGRLSVPNVNPLSGV